MATPASGIDDAPPAGGEDGEGDDGEGDAGAGDGESRQSFQPGASEIEWSEAQETVPGLPDGTTETGPTVPEYSVPSIIILSQQASVLKSTAVTAWPSPTRIVHCCESEYLDG